MEHYKNQRRLPKKFIYQIVMDIIPLLRSLPTLVDIDVPAESKFTVCGDVHGQYWDACNIFELNGLPSEENPYLFNGDFVDRGSFSIEIIMLFFSLKLLYPKHFHMMRGNHESVLTLTRMSAMARAKAPMWSRLAAPSVRCAL